MMEEREEFEEASIRFECRKIGIRHSKAGIILSVAIHPDEMPIDMVRDFLGQRYFAVLVRMNDQDEPVASKDIQEGNKAIKLAGTLCRDEEFQAWMVTIGMAEKPDEETVTEALRIYLGVTSRKELKSNHDARRKLLDLRTEFIESFKRVSP
jgi:hypothetical protein